MTKTEFIGYVNCEQDALRSFLLALCCGNKDDADDIAQDALLKAYLSISIYKDEKKFRSWLFKIAYNTFLNYKTRHRSFLSLNTLSDNRNVGRQGVESLASGFAADSAFAHQDLYMALATLPPKERSAMVLFYMNGYSVKEIAKITDTSGDAVKQQLSRGREKIRKTLKL